MRRSLNIISGLAAIGAAVAAFIAFWPAPTLDISEAKAHAPQGQALIDRGRYLTLAADCAACHTTPGGAPFAGGFEFKLPFGTLYSPNITPDVETGIGSWSEEAFVRAVRYGVDAQGQNLYPAFVYPSYHLMSDEDALAIRAYIFSLAPVKLQNRANDMSFPFKYRFIMRFWNLISIPPGPLKPDPNQSASWNRGNYLVNALAHCGECHTPRTPWFSSNPFRPLAGAPVGGWFAYNVTPDKRGGVGDWSDAELIDYLSSGHAHNHGTAVGDMGQAVDLSLRHLPIEDIKDMATYLHSVAKQSDGGANASNPDAPGVKNASLFLPAPNLDVAFDGGAQIYAGFCASCHGWNGEGVAIKFASIKGASTVSAPDGVNLIQVVLNGAHLTSENGPTFMPDFKYALSDDDIAQLANFVLRHYSDKQSRITPEQVAKARAAGG